MNRRELLQCAAILIGGVSASRLGFALNEEQRVYLATAPDYINRDGNYLTEAQRKIVAAMAEIIIPRTDTPGAIDAGVPRFIELMYGQWFNDQERSIFDKGLAGLEQDVPARYGVTFDQLEPGEQLEIMQKMEDAVSDHSWYDFANVEREFISDAPFICQIKELTIWGFFTSETGATQVLRHNMMPMRFDGNFPLKPGDSTWSSGLL